MMSHDVLDCTNVPFGNRGNACDELVAYGCWDMRLVPIFCRFPSSHSAKTIVYVLCVRFPSLDAPCERDIILIVFWECQSLWWAAGAAAGRFPARAVFPCRFRTPWVLVERGSQPKASFFCLRTSFHRTCPCVPMRATVCMRTARNHADRHADYIASVLSHFPMYRKYGTMEVGKHEHAGQESGT